MFCTQYVAEVYKQLGVLSSSTITYLITPNDFEIDNIELNPGYSFGPIVNFRTLQ